MNRQTVGKFRIGWAYLEHIPQRVAEVFAFLKIIPISIEASWHTHDIEYLAMGDCFPEKEENEHPPVYVFEIEQNKDGTVKKVEVFKEETYTVRRWSDCGKIAHHGFGKMLEDHLAKKKKGGDD